MLFLRSLLGCFVDIFDYNGELLKIFIIFKGYFWCVIIVWINFDFFYVMILNGLDSINVVFKEI